MVNGVSIQFRVVLISSVVSVDFFPCLQIWSALSAFSNHSFFRFRWKMAKRLFFGPRGVWGKAGGQHQQNGCDYFSSAAESFDHWKISSNENFLRMRMKLIPNPNFDIHASARYNHTRTQNGFSNVFMAKKSLDGGNLQSVSKGFELEQQRKTL